ncbi:hypothetical protein DENSPDRAFT_886584 [Dentipellis sp. KUC8613]|nr:hypothetical protein DENSPDRAFT_886584 [Dentipellis sp. KUC8613]
MRRCGSSLAEDQELAIQYLMESLEAELVSARSCIHGAGQKYNKAYKAYQQAVYPNGRNPKFCCSSGVLYFQINQFHVALDAYSCAIRINPYIPEVWFDLDAYARSAELDPSNTTITQRLQLLKHLQATRTSASALVPPPGLS